MEQPVDGMIETSFHRAFVMSIKFSLAAAALFASHLASAGPTNDVSLLGFSREAAENELALEKKYDALLKKEELRDWMKWITSQPHHLGSPHGKEVAEFIAAKFREWGYQTEIEKFDVLFPTPKTRLLEMSGPQSFRARLEEPALPGDTTSSIRSNLLPVYNAYSPDGDVRGELVYVNFGLPADYEILAQHGIDVKGKIVLARYGESWRGIKPKVAAEHGAIACLIYSDPQGDGYVAGEAYPNGPWRNAEGAQRGSVADIPVYPGDPLTPGFGSTNGAARIPIKDAVTLAKIPVLPISHADALPFLRALAGPVAPQGWRGGLPLTYHLGPGPAQVHLQLEFHWDQAPCYDVIAKMPGAEFPDEWVLRGNHHDAWVFGADDPVSGTVSVMEEARAISDLVRTGWKPRRTLVFTVWDGEEPGLLGSTEWVETHALELTEKAVAYINGDTNERGVLSAGGSHTLEHFVNEIARDIQDPEKKVPVGERLRAHEIVAARPENRKDLRERTDFRIYAMGSGSDYSPFLQHLGIASLDLRYANEERAGSYHSVYDSFDNYTRFLDPGFEYGIMLAKTSGRAVLRLANAEILPFEFNDFSETISRYVKELVKLNDDMREETRETNRLIHDRALELAADPRQTFIVPKPKGAVPFLNFAPLQNSLHRLQESSLKFETARKRLPVSGPPLPGEAESAINAVLMKAERALTRNEGLPRRSWYRHQIYAPGFYTGYGVKTLPGAREAIERRTWTEAGEQIEIVSRTLDNFSHEIDRATDLLPASKN